MASPSDMIREYLVGLGFALDESSFRKATSAMDSIDKRVNNFIGRFATAGKAAGLFGTAILGVTAATGKLLNNLGNQEIQMEMLSRQMWTTQKTAQAFSLTLQALHANIQQLYLSPTLMSQYRQLFAVAQRLTPNTSAYDAQIRKVQDISLQFKQMRLEMSYAKQWFGMAFIKDMSGPLGGLENRLKSLNTTIIKDIPAWTSKIASVAAGFFQSFSVMGDAIGNVYGTFQKLGSYLPTWVKVMVGGFAALDLVMASNPFFLAIEGLTALLLLMDDYYVWSKGGKSALGGFWTNATHGIKMFESALKKNGVIKDFGTLMKNLKVDLDGIQNSLNGFNMSKLTNGMNSAAKSIDRVVRLMNQLVIDLGYFTQTSSNTITNPNELHRNYARGITDAGFGSNLAPGTPPLKSHMIFGGADFLGQNIGNGFAGALQAIFGGHQTAPMSGDARLQAALKSGNNHPSNVTINQTNNFTGTASQSDVMTGLNQSNTLMMRQFQTVIK